MKMRVSIARALVMRPALLLMDEPFAALDEITRTKLNDDLVALKCSLGATVVFVTHSVYESVALSTRIIVMAPRPGRVVAEITVDAPLPRDEEFRLGEILCGQVPGDFARAAWRDGGQSPFPQLQNVKGRHALEQRRNFLNMTLPTAGARPGAAGLGIHRLVAGDPALYPACAEPHPRDALIKDWGTLYGSLLVTLRITFEALLAAILGGVALAMLFAQSRIIERAFFPFAVIMQVTPVIAIAPLLLIYLSANTAVLVCAFLVAFFPDSVQHRARPGVGRS